MQIVGKSGVPTTTTSGDPIGGMTIGKDIYTASPADYDAFWGATWAAIEFAVHEITHTQQSLRAGGRGTFLLLYGLAGLAEAMLVPASEAYGATYKNNVFEKKAQANAARIVKDLKKKGKSTCPIDMGNIGIVNTNIGT